MREEVAATVDAALVQLDRAAAEASVHDDPLQLPFTALAAFLRAQRQLYADADVSLARHIETARQPVRDDEFRRAVISGISAHATKAVDAMNWRSTISLTLGGLVLAGVGFAGGALWQHGIASAELEAAQSVIVKAHDGFPGGLKARDVALWQDLIRMNPGVEEAMRSCKSMPQSRGGSACALPVWTLPPPPPSETPATR
jgi:hypothetical protein